MTNKTNTPHRDTTDYSHLPDIPVTNRDMDYTPEEVSDDDAYMTMADAGITPEQVPDKKERAAYEKYLKNHKE